MAQFIEDCGKKISTYVKNSENGLANNLDFLNNVVEEYYDAQAVKRYCFALCKCDTTEMMGITLDSSSSCLIAQRCNICALSSDRLYKMNTRILPEILRSRSDAGMEHDLLLLGEPHVYPSPEANIVMLVYRAADRRTIYNHSIVQHAGELRLTFTMDLKILSWDFCVRHLDVRRNLPLEQMTSVAPHDQAEVRRVTELIKSTLDSSGFPKAYSRLIRRTEISTTLHSIGGVMEYSYRHKVGPIESLNLYRRYPDVDQNVTTIPELENELGMDHEAGTATASAAIQALDETIQAFGVDQMPITTQALENEFGDEESEQKETPHNIVDI